VNNRRVFLFSRQNSKELNYNFVSGSPLAILYKRCRLLQPDDIIVYFGNSLNIDVNNFDVGEFVTKYQSYGKKIVITAEKNLWPDSLEGARYKLLSLGPEKSEFKYLNSGMVCGEAGEIMRLLEERVFDPTAEPNEQEYLSRAYVTERYNMTLDYDCKLCICAYKCSGEEIAAARAAGVPFVYWNAGR
jgi:hypothetical protein